MKIRFAVLAFTILASFTARAGIDPSLPNLVPIFPDRLDGNFMVTNRLGAPTLEFEILTANIGGQDWIRPPIDRDVACQSSRQYFRMPQTHEYAVYWYDPDLGDYVQIDRRRKDTICIQDDASRGNNPLINCLQEHGVTFPCGCNSTRYGPGTGNGVSRGWADSYFRNLLGQWAFIGDYTGDFILTGELDPDLELQADDLLDRERDATHDDNISYVYFTYNGGFGPVLENVQVVHTFDPVCPAP